MGAMLLVDDDPDLGEALREALLVEGIDLHVSDDAQQALDLARTVHPTLVLLDYQLPGVDVSRLVEALRAVCPAPIILCTGMDQPDARRDEIGADGVLSKPFSIEAVLRLARRPAHPAAAP